MSEISLERYVQRVLDAVDAAGERVILVGHSSGGVVVAQATELRPERVARAVYLCAYLPADGQSVLDLGATDREGLIIPNLVVSDDGTTATVREDVIQDALFADCSVEDYLRAVARFVPQALAPATTPVRLTSEGFGRVARAYVECRHDRAISPDLQRRMYTGTPCDEVLTLDTGHSPQYAAPEVLAARLGELAVRPSTARVGAG